MATDPKAAPARPAARPAAPVPASERQPEAKRQAAEKNRVDADARRTREFEEAPIVDGDPRDTKSKRVRAIQQGYYNHERKREGDVFTLDKVTDFSLTWMERVGGRVPERTTTPQQVVDREHDRILGDRAPTSDRTGDQNPLGA